MKGLLTLTFCLLLSSCTAEKTTEDIFLEKYRAALNSTGIPPDQLLVDPDEYQSVSIPFNCKPLSNAFINTPPASVHELSPYHIKAVGAVGDSVTEGFGASAKYLWDALKTYRGVSWSIGGDQDISKVFTIPNILREFNKNVVGASVGTKDSGANFNLAKSGAVAEDIPDQVDRLIAKIKDSGLADEWKLITVWIGGNDLCAYCDNKEKHSPENYVRHIKDGLDKLKSELPKTYVNLVEILDVTPLTEVGTGDLICGAVKLFACNCASKPETSDAFKKYNEGLEALIGNNSYDENPDFTVVLQPFYKNLILPTDKKQAKDYLGLDCFHFNDRGHARIALELWNDMLIPEGKNKEGLDFVLDTQPDVICPTDSAPYFYTRKNSLKFSGTANSDQDSPDTADSPPNLLGIILGTSLTTFTVAVAVIMGVIAIAYTRHRRRRNSIVRGVTVGMSVDTEKTRLIFRQ